MPTMAVMQGTGLTTSASHPYCLFIDNLDVIKQPGTPGSVFGVDIDSITLTEGIGQPPTLEFVIDDPTRALTLNSGASVYFVDHRGRILSSGTIVTSDLFRGILESHELVPGSGVSWKWHCVAHGLDVLLDRRIIPSGVVPASVINGAYAAAVQYIMSLYGGNQISALQRDTTAINQNNLFAATGALSVAIPLSGKTLRQALNDLAPANDQFATFSAVYQNSVSVDSQGRLLALGQDYRNPPFLGNEGFKEGTLALASNPAPANINVDVDTSNLVNAVYIRGVDIASSGWVTDDTSIATYGRFEAFLDAPECTSSVMVNTLGGAYLGDHAAVTHVAFTLNGSHDQLTKIADGVGIGNSTGDWHVNINTQLFSTTGYWTNGANFNLAGMTMRWQGGGTVIDLELHWSARAKSGGFQINSRLNDTLITSKAGQRIVGTLGEVAVRSKAGVPTDADFDSARDGFITIDTTNGVIWVRSLGSWKPAPFAYGARITSASATSTLTLAVAAADVAGATITATAQSAELWLVTGVFEFICSVVGTNVGVGTMLFDGVAQAGNCDNSGATLDRVCLTQSWIVNASAGSHTVKLQGNKTVNDGTHQIVLSNTRIILQQFPA